MRTIGIILAVIVAGLAAYIVWGLVTGSGVAYAAAGGTANTLNRTAGSNAKTPPPGTGTFRKWDPQNASAMTTGIASAIEKITGAKVLGFSTPTKQM